MDAYATDEQQWEAIKAWFKKYGNRLSWVLIIVLSVILAIQYWYYHQSVVRQEASDLYMALLVGIEQQDPPTVKSKALLLKEQYATSPYAAFSALFLARQAIEANDLAQAEKELAWAMENGTDSLQPLARLRLIRLKIAENKLDEALSLYEESKAGGFLTLMAELKGDILMQKKDLAGAQKAYEKALESAPEEGMHGPLLKMKIESKGKGQ